MRYKRTERFKKQRRKKAHKFFILAVIMPAILILLGYLVATVIILPSMTS